MKVIYNTLVFLHTNIGIHNELSLFIQLFTLVMLNKNFCIIYNQQNNIKNVSTIKANQFLTTFGSNQIRKTRSIVRQTDHKSINGQSNQIAFNQALQKVFFVQTTISVSPNNHIRHETWLNFSGKDFFSKRRKRISPKPAKAI